MRHPVLIWQIILRTPSEGFNWPILYCNYYSELSDCFSYRILLIETSKLSLDGQLLQIVGFNTEMTRVSKRQKMSEILIVDENVRIQYFFILIIIDSEKSYIKLGYVIFIRTFATNEYLQIFQHIVKFLLFTSSSFPFSVWTSDLKHLIDDSSFWILSKVFD